MHSCSHARREEQMRQGRQNKYLTAQLEKHNNAIARSFQSGQRNLRGWFKREKQLCCVSTCLRAGRKNAFIEGCTNLQQSTLTWHAATVDHKDAISIVQLQIERVATEEKLQSSRNDGLIKQLRTAYCLAKGRSDTAQIWSIYRAALFTTFTLC